MQRFKDTLVAKGSALAEAIKTDKKLAEKVYKVTTENYCAKYSKEDREWFNGWKPIHITE